MSEPQPKVLVIDDDPANLELVTRRLEVEGFEMALVENGQGGIELAQGETFDAVLLDLRLPDMNGLEVLEALQRHRPELPVVIMTAHGSEAIAVKALTAGAADYLIKPISRRDLIAALRGAIDRQRRLKAHREAQDTLVEALEDGIAAEVRERSQLAELLDALEEGVLLLEPNGNVEAFNRAGLALLRMGEPPGSLADLYAQIEAITDEQGRQLDLTVPLHFSALRDVEYVVHWKDGVNQAFSVTTKVFGDRGETSGWVVVFRDVTAERARRLRLEVLLAEAESRRAEEVAQATETAEAVKSSILSNVSHELRTPLNFIVGFGSVLADGVVGQLEPRQQALVEKMLAGADRLTHTIEDLLDYAMLASGRILIEPARVSLRAAAEQALAAARLAGEEAGLTLRLEAEGAPEAWADPAIVGKVLSYLLGNALKFTPKGGEVVVRVGEHEGLPTVSVTDTGIGIAEQELPRLFDEFYQVERQATRRFGGTGMGLALARGMAERMGGRLEVESQPGHGSTFRLVLRRE